VPTEFPRTNDGLLGVRQRYSYNPIVAREPTLLFEGFIKYDVERGTEQNRYRYGQRRWGGETSFVPRVAGGSEDDGYLLTYVTDDIEQSSELLIFDALHIDQGPLAAIELPQRIPALFHTQWISAADMAQQEIVLCQK